jgi:hypothetical protein
MSILRRIMAHLFPSNVPSSVPPWADFFSLEQYQAFVAKVTAFFTQRNRKVELGDGVVFVAEEGRPAKHQLGLLNLAQMCARNDADEWDDIIADHFKTLEKSHKEQKVLEERVDNFERVAELLSVRLWPDGYLKELDSAKLVHRRDLPGTISALVFDLPSSIRNVTPDEAQAWGKSHDELFEIGLANVRETCIPDVSEQQLNDEVTITLLADESFFVASHALLLEDKPDLIGPFGSLVGVPHRHVLLAYPIADLRVMPALHMMIPIIHGMEREGPGSISSLLYWYKNGEFTNLPYSIKENTLNFSPPEEFVEMLHLLSDP